MTAEMDEIDMTNGNDGSSGDLETDPVITTDNMPRDARRVLVHLMRQGLIIAAQNQKLFDTVRRYESFVRRHLSEVYLRLVLDARAGVAFVASHESRSALAPEPRPDPALASAHPSAHPLEQHQDIDFEDDFVTLIVRRPLTLYDTLLLLVLRKHYQERESAGEQKITIDIEGLESYLTPFLPLTEHSSLDRKKLIARVKEMVRRKILSTIRGSEERYEITPIIRYVVDAEFLETMINEYKRLAAE